MSAHLQTHADSASSCRRFQAAGGAEYFISVTAPKHLDFAGQIDFIAKRYTEARQAVGLAPETATFRRIFVSDVMNQAALVRNNRLFEDQAEGPVAVSIVQQPPLPGSKITLLAYHVESAAPVTKRRLSPKHLLIEKGELNHLWSTRLCAGAYGSPADVVPQTRQLFSELIETLAAEGGTLGEHCVRTWIYVKDVDVFYQGMVDSRIELFTEQGLTANTHYIASTGIEGACAHRYDLVAMDAYSILGLLPGQVSYHNDFDRLCPTKDYNVTFERGTRIAYADRSHHFISGTASIDPAGQVVHPGDVMRQLERALGNVDALLQSGGTSLDHMMHFIVYLRDPTDFARVNGYLLERFPGLPTVIVQGAVCRPDWLIEVEGIAVSGNDQPELPAF